MHQLVSLGGAATPPAEQIVNCTASLVQAHRASSCFSKDFVTGVCGSCGSDQTAGLNRWLGVCPSAGCQPPTACLVALKRQDLHPTFTFDLMIQVRPPDLAGRVLILTLAGFGRPASKVTRGSCSTLRLAAEGPSLADLRYLQAAPHWPLALFLVPWRVAFELLNIDLVMCSPR